MKQVLQNLSSGETELADVPAPQIGSGKVLIRTRRSLLSAGTERMLVDFGKAGFIGKARQQPDKVREVLQKMRTDGIATTVEAVRHKLDQPLPLGYSSVGVVLEVGSAVDAYAPGDRVVSNGPHAELVAVPRHLTARVPDGVDDDSAAFTVVASIALQGIRLVSPTLGETIVVTGLGLIGLLAVQILRANGCRVIGIDFDEAKLALAGSFGAETVNLAKGEDPVAAALALTDGRGVDGVLLTAATSSSEPVSQAAKMSRKRGRIVLVGVTGLELSRADFYEKELTFQVSCSYGPGRYDPDYEDRGNDYPLPYVRWTEQRNFEAVLDLMARGLIDVKPLISQRFSILDAPKAYEHLSAGTAGLGTLLEYGEDADPVAERARVLQPSPAVPRDSAVVSFIGAGNYAGRILIPAFREAGASLASVSATSGVGVAHYGRKHGFRRVTTDTDSVLSEADAHAVVIATRHDSHASLAARVLESGKDVFVEKPLAITIEELEHLERVYQNERERRAASGARPPLLMVGFNRRFAPHVVKVRELLRATPGPKAFVMTVNAGEIPGSHWTQNPSIGGGRVIGEACHFVDLLRHLAGAPIRGFDVRAAGPGGMTADTVTISLSFADDSIGTVHYLANGHKSFPKERLEVFASGRVLQLDNFRKLRGFGWPGFRTMNLWKQDKGQEACAAAFVGAVRAGGVSPIPADELFEVSRKTIEIAREL